MHKVAIYRRYAYQSPNHRPRWSLVLTIQHVNKHEIVFHNLYISPALRQGKYYAKKLRYVLICKMDAPSAGEKTGISNSSVMIRERSVRSGAIEGRNCKILRTETDMERFDWLLSTYRYWRVKVEVMKHYFMFVYMVYSLKMVSTKDHRGLWLVDWYAYLR